jgi:hypothetical protein
MAVNDILRTLQNNGVTQKDLKGIDKQLMNQAVDLKYSYRETV